MIRRHAVGIDQHYRLHGRVPVDHEELRADVANYFRLWYGPTLRAFAALDEANRNGLRRDLEAIWTDHNRATDGTTRVQSEYLEVRAVVK